MIEEHRSDCQQLRIKFAEDVVGVVSAVIVADPGVVAPNDKVRASVVLADDGMKDRFARPGISHRRRIDGQKGPGPGKVMLKHFLVTTHSDFGRDVVGFGFSNQRMKQQAVNAFKRAFYDVFMRPVYWIAGLEGQDTLPSLFAE